jgi:hypothetical protein
VNKQNQKTKRIVDAVSPGGERVVFDEAQDARFCSEYPE